MNREFLLFRVRCFRAFIQDGAGVIESGRHPDRDIMEGDRLTVLFNRAGITYSRRVSKFGEVTLMVPKDQLRSAVNSLEGEGLTGTVNY